METATRSLSYVEQPLGISDRCDRCGAQAYVRATMPSGASLLLCGHHGNTHRAQLIVAGAAIHDQTDSIVTKRESGFGG